MYAFSEQTCKQKSFVARWYFNSLLSSLRCSMVATSSDVFTVLIVSTEQLKYRTIAHARRVRSHRSFYPCFFYQRKIFVLDECATHHISMCALRDGFALCESIHRSILSVVRTYCSGSRTLVPYEITTIQSKQKGMTS